jgi:ATP-dependent Clp protease ATP-binding subunit ClpA
MDQAWEGEVHPTTGVQRVLQRAAFQAQSSGEWEVRVKSVIESILNEKHSYAVSLLNQRR